MSMFPALPFLLALSAPLQAAGSEFQRAAGVPRDAAASEIQAVPAHVWSPESLGTRARRDELYFDIETDGTQWVRGRTYKASFDASGATYIPFLGSDAPRNYPVELSLASATSGGVDIELLPAQGAVREGNTIRMDRGPIDEVYELALDSIEQTFVVKERPSGSDLRLFVAIEAELTSRESADGFEFGNERGSVRYSRAFVREQSGARTPIPSRLVPGGVWIEVDAATLDRATYPLVVDPIVSTFSINVAAGDQAAIDVSYDSTSTRYLVVYNEVFSQTDYDVVSDRLSSSNETFLSRSYIDASTENWNGAPSVANLRAGGKFLVACSTDSGPGTPSSVRARTVAGVDHAVSAKFVVAAGTATEDRVNCDVGGDPFLPELGGTSGVYFCVVWENRFSSGAAAIQARLVTNGGALVGAGPLTVSNSPSTSNRVPSISKSNGESRWNVAWTRTTNTGNLDDIYAAQIRFDGILITPTFLVSGSSTAESGVSVTSPRGDGTYMIAWLRDLGPHNDIYAALVQGSSVLNTANITALELAGNVGDDQQNVEADTDGDKFVLVYDETSIFPSSRDVRLTSISTFANQFEVSESHLALDASFQSDRMPSIAAWWSSGVDSRRFIAAWTETSANGQHSDVRAGTFLAQAGGPVTSFCAGDGTNTTPCPCGNNGALGHGCGHSFSASGARLTGSAGADLGNDQLVLAVSGMPTSATCTFFQGTTGNSTATPFGDGLRCTVGSVLRLKSISAVSGTAQFPAGGDPQVSVAGLIPASGGVRYYQVTYRNAASFCTAGTFNITNGLRALWLP